MAAIADNNEGEAGGSGKSSSKRKRGGKKGAAGEDMGDFYVDDTQPIERLPKARKDDADVQVRGVAFCLYCGWSMAVGIWAISTWMMRSRLSGCLRHARTTHICR
jgi:hypothetical protein